MEAETKTLHLKVPEELHRKLKIAGATKDLSLQDIAVEALEEWLKQSRRAKE